MGRIDTGANQSGESPTLSAMDLPAPETLVNFRGWLIAAMWAYWVYTDPQLDRTRVDDDYFQEIALKHGFETQRRFLCDAADDAIEVALSRLWESANAEEDPWADEAYDAWKPNTPDGWRLLAKYESDSEGPVVWFGKRIGCDIDAALTVTGEPEHAGHALGDVSPGLPNPDTS